MWRLPEFGPGSAFDEFFHEFVSEPAAGHAGHDFQKIGGNAFIEAPHAFGLEDDFDGVKYAIVLVTHSRHGVDLEPSPKDVTENQLDGKT